MSEWNTIYDTDGVIVGILKDSHFNLNKTNPAKEARVP